MAEPARAFVSDGYAILPDFLSTAEMSSLQQWVDILVQSADGETCARPNNTLVPLRWDEPLVSAVLGGAHRMQRLADTIGATDLRWISGYVSVKHAHSLALWWHQDWWCWDHPLTFRPAGAQVALLCYLTDTNSGNGALRVLPGSHRRSHRVHAALPEAHDDLSAGHDPYHDVMRDQPGQVTISLRAGDAVVLDYRTLHGTHPNATASRRDAVLLNFTPTWRDLPAEIRGHLISHAALPSAGEAPAIDHPITAYLPTYVGPHRDLPLSRNAPTKFRIDS